MHKVLRLLLLLGLLVEMLPSTGQSNGIQSDGAGLELSGRVTNLRSEIPSKSHLVHVTATLSVEFVNRGSKPILILTENSPLCVGTTLTRNAGPAVANNILFDQYRGPSVSTAPEWAALRRALDKPMPPDGIVRVIKPGNSWEEELTIVIAPPIKLEKYRVDRPAVSWELLRQASPVWLRLQCDAWPFNLEPRPLSGKFQLGRELQKRWRGLGVLQLDSIVSEPMILNLLDP